MMELHTKSDSDVDTEEIEYKIEKATETLERNIGFISNCDNKTSIVLTALGVLLTIILTNDGLNAIFSIVRSCTDIRKRYIVNFRRDCITHLTNKNNRNYN